MRGIHQKGMRGKSNVITKLRQKYKVKIWGARYTLGARYLSKNTVVSQIGGNIPDEPPASNCRTRT